jgi:hypothetical protein
VGEPAHWYSLVETETGRVELGLDDTPVASAPNHSGAAAWLLWHINRSVADASTEYVLLHAGGVTAGVHGVVFPAPMGSGKSTLVAGLVQRGLGYLSDELVAVTPTGSASGGSRLEPYPKALALDARSCAALRCDVCSAGRPLVGGDKMHILCESLRPGSIARSAAARTVIVPRYRKEGETTLVALNGRDALMALVTNTVNLERHGGDGIRVLADLAERSHCYRLEMSDLDEACRLVLDALHRCAGQRQAV